MKILWVKAGPFAPLDTGSKIRTWNVLCELGKLDAVTALSYYPFQFTSSQNPTEHTLAQLIRLPYPAPAKHSFAYYLDYLRRLPVQPPYAVYQYLRPEARYRIRELCCAQHFDMVICDGLSSSLNVPFHSECLQVLFAHNVETVLWKRHREVEHRLFRKLVIGLEYWKMQRFEAAQAKQFDHVLTVSDVDRDLFARFLPPERISVLPTGVDLDYFRPASGPESNDRLVFTGSMDWPPNEDAILFFAREILPHIVRAKPAVRLQVVGRDPSSQLRQLAKSNPHVAVVGGVPDIRPYVAAASVYVVPLRVGSGTRLKIYEAMAMGKSVVSTGLGAEGLPVRHDEHLLLADRPAEFAAVVVQLLADANLRLRLGQAARRFAESNYGWPRVGRICHDILLQAMKMRSVKSGTD